MGRSLACVKSFRSGSSRPRYGLLAREGYMRRKRVKCLRLGGHQYLVGLERT